MPVWHSGAVNIASVRPWQMLVGFRASRSIQPGTRPQSGLFAQLKAPPAQRAIESIASDGCDGNSGYTRHARAGERSIWDNPSHPSPGQFH